jgi:(p)ppGpp synthase/HD superfamily hydrolase
MTDSKLVLEAISFAARAHRHQLRKDQETPYVAHVVRVLFICRDQFGVTDPRILAAAALHDTIEDTTTDFDDLNERFGTDVAQWVAALTKDGRLIDAERERAYSAALIAAGTPVLFCKLADMFDNLTDSDHLKPEAKAKTLKRIRMYLDGLKSAVTTETERAYQIVETKWRELSSQ